MEQQANPPPPPSPQIKDEASQKPKRAIFLSQIWGRGWGKRRGVKFPISTVQDILSARVARCMDFALHGGVVFSLRLSFQVLKTNWKLHAACGLSTGKGRRLEGPNLPSPEPQLHSRLPPSFIRDGSCIIYRRGGCGGGFGAKHGEIQPILPLNVTSLK